MSARPSSAESGATLLEALVALALMAVTALGVISAQWWMARGENAVAVRERAAFIVDSIAEASRGSTSEPDVLARWNAQAASALPRGEALARETGDGLSLSIVRWAAPGQAPHAQFDETWPCAAAAGTVEGPCAAIAFVR